MSRRKSVSSKSKLSGTTGSASSMAQRRQSRAQNDKSLQERTHSSIKLTVTGDDGRDVTPKSLFTGIPHDRASQIQLEENSSSIDFRSMASFFMGTGMGTQAVSLFGQSILGSQSKVLRD